MITETLGPEILLSGRISQTQLYKVVFTTLYVDFKEPAVRSFRAPKKLNFVPHAHSAFAASAFAQSDCLTE